jgi:hypothetical protein
VCRAESQHAESQRVESQRAESQRVESQRVESQRAESQRAESQHNRQLPLKHTGWERGCSTRACMTAAHAWHESLQHA